MVRHLPVRRFVLLPCVFAAALLLPASYTPVEGVIMHDACALGGCCIEVGSFCGDEFGAYLPNSSEMCSAAFLQKNFGAARP